MSELAKQPVLIDDRGGQAGVLGTNAVAKANPDGSTIGIVSASALVISPTMEKVAYDVAKDFAPVTLVATMPEMPSLPATFPPGTWPNSSRLRKRSPANSISLRGRRRPAASRRRTEADGEPRHRARALSRRGAGHKRSARAAGADDIPRFAGIAAAYQGRHAAPDRARGSPACADRARRADHRGSRHARSPDRELVRHDRAGGGTRRRISSPGAQPHCK